MRHALRTKRMGAAISMNGLECAGYPDVGDTGNFSCCPLRRENWECRSQRSVASANEQQLAGRGWSQLWDGR